MRTALRIARRELLRSRGRTLLVLVMVLLPVTVVVAGDTLLRTASINVVEGLPDTLGDAEAEIRPAFGGGAVTQSPDVRRTQSGGRSSGPTSVTDSDLLAAVSPGARLQPVRDSIVTVVCPTDAGLICAAAVGVDLRDPAMRGPYRLLSGRAPATTDEVAVTSDLTRVLPVGARFSLATGAARTVTGTVDSPSQSRSGAAAVVGLPAAVGISATAPVHWYVFGPAVTWDDVLAVNALGATVLSRSVVLDPPPDDRVPPLDDGYPAEPVALIALIVVMAVLEVVLLAGPAFAVGARRQRRALALLAANGGEPRHVRRVELPQGLLVGALAAVIGLPLGIGIAALARGPLMRYTEATFGPFEVSLRDVVLFALLAAATALLAAVWPAYVTARQPVVAALQGRRLVPARAARPSLIGLVLFVLGALGTIAALRGVGRTALALDSTFGVALWAVPTVLGAILLAPAVLAGLGRIAGRLPLPLRFAVRDADRQRGRTAPAVAAVAATVAAVVALGIASSSDSAERRRGYSPTGALGTAVVTAATTNPLTGLPSSLRSAGRFPVSRYRCCADWRPRLSSDPNPRPSRSRCARREHQNDVSATCARVPEAIRTDTAATSWSV